MKKIVTLLSIICLFVVPMSSYGQEMNRTQMQESVRLEVKKQMDNFSKSLALSEAQKPLVQKSLTEYLMSKTELDNLNMSTENLSRRMEALNQYHIAGMDKILSPKQMQLYLKQFSEASE